MTVADNNSRVVARYTERTRVTMEWELDAELEDTEGNGVKCVGWLADASALLAQCTPDNAHKTTISRVERTPCPHPPCGGRGRYEVEHNGGEIEELDCVVCHGTGEAI